MVNDVQPGWARAARPARELARWAAAGLLALVLTAAAILWWRRLAGAFSDPLEPAALLVVSTSIAAVVALTRTAGRYGTGGRGAGRRSRLAGGTLSAATVAIAAALSYPGTPARGLVILWAVLAAGEIWAWRPAGWWRIARATRVRATTPEPPPGGAAESGASRPAIPAPRFGEPPGDEVTQQMTRSRTAGGSEVLAGWIRLPMAAGQRSANVHLSFCPAFARIPRVSVEQRGGPRARIKAVQVLPHGARFDLKLAALSETAQTVLLEFSAEAAPAATGSEPTGPEPESPSEA